MADGIIQVPPNSTGVKVDGASLSVGGVDVFRQRFVLGDNVTAVFAEVVGASASTSAVGVVVRPTTATIVLAANQSIGIGSIGTVTVTGTVSLGAGTALIGDINAISRTVQVAIGTPFTINNISAAVAVTGTVSLGAGTNLIGAVSLAAGTSNIGFLNNISASVTVIASGFFDSSSGSTTTVRVGDSANSAVRVNIVAGGTGGGLVSITGTAIVALAAGTNNIGFINNISAPIVLAAGTANIGSINNISATVLVAGTLSIGSFVDKGAYTASQGTVTVIGGMFDDTATNLSQSQAGATRVTSARAMHVNLRDAAGNEVGVVGAPVSVKVERTSATASVVLAAGTANIGSINNISATVIVAGVVSIGAGTNLMGAVSLAAGTANIGSINNISATVLVAGTLSIGSFLDKSAFTASQGSVTVMGGMFDDTATMLSQSQAGAVRLTSARAMHVNLRNAAGAEYTAAAPLSVKVEQLSAGSIAVTGTVSLGAGTNLIGAVSLAAGTANIGVLNNISATVIVAGVVSLGAGTANFGTLNDISRTVQVAVGTPFILQGISTTVQVAVGTPFIIQGISTTVTTVTQITGISAGVSIGINSISATVNVAGSVFLNIAPAVNSASRGPVSVVLTATAAAVVVASVGATSSVYITTLMCSNRTTSNLTVRFGTSASGSAIQQYLVSLGGGFVLNFNPPWQISLGEAFVGGLDVSVGGTAGILANVHYYVK